MGMVGSDKSAREKMKIAIGILKNHLDLLAILILTAANFSFFFRDLLTGVLRTFCDKLCTNQTYSIGVDDCMFS